MRQGQLAWDAMKGLAQSMGCVEPIMFADRRWYHGSNEDPFPTGRVPRKRQDLTSSDKLK